MKALPFSILAIAVISVPTLDAQEVRLTLAREGTALRLTHATVSGMQYELQRSDDLLTWEPLSAGTPGDGSPIEHEVGEANGGSGFFRVLVTEAPGGWAPTPAEAVALLVGTEFEGYQFLSATRFNWFGEGGNWSYSQTGPNSGLLVFTYDEDGNNPAVWREEVWLTFTAPGLGTYVYKEFDGGAETYSSPPQPFNLN